MVGRLSGCSFFKKGYMMRFLMLITTCLAARVATNLERGELDLVVRGYENRYYFMGVPVVNAIGSILTKAATGHSITHSYVCIETDDGYYLAEMANRRSHDNRSGLELIGPYRSESDVDRAAESSCHIVYVKNALSERSLSRKVTLRDVLNWMETLDGSYDLTRNNCQMFAQNFYQKF